MPVFNLKIILLLISGFSVVICSIGDRSKYFQLCVTKCTNTTCNDKDVSWAGVWSCPDDCKYDCMWDTVHAFIKYGFGVPQFYGKWPFVRWMSMQEPASAVFSGMNLISHAWMLRRFILFVPQQAPLFWLWVSYGLVCMNAWFWSTVFHTRDNNFTESMDYFCAFSMVLLSLYTACIRLIGSSHSMSSLLVTALCVIVMISHIFYLWFVKFDYDYNMKANIFVGGLNMLCWLLWCWTRRFRCQHMWKCAVTVLLASISVVLETADFPPIGWMIDAHALWHLSTVPLPILWYSFLIDDCLHLMKENKYSDKSV